MLKQGLVFIFTVMMSQSASADKVGSKVTSYSSDDGAVLSIVRYGPRTDKTYLLYFENFDHDWDGKVFLHYYNDTTNNKKYELRIPTGLKLRKFDVFQSVVDSGQRNLRNGTIVPMVSVYLKGVSDSIKMSLSEAKIKPIEILAIFENQDLDLKSFFSDKKKGLSRVIEYKETKEKPGIYSQSHALLIGASDYTQGWPDLESIPSEIQRVEAVLKAQGFAVQTLMNPVAGKLEQGFKDFINKYGYDKDSRLLFFYSGHGYTRMDGNKGYLVPTDAPNPESDEQGFLRKALAMNQILAWSRQIESNHVLFLFDSCFSGTVFKTKALPKTPPHITKATTQPVRQFITAGSAGEEVPAKSVFTPAFIDALQYSWGDLNKDGYVTGTELGIYLQSKVPQHSSQSPQFGKIADYDLSRGDFVFANLGNINININVQAPVTKLKSPTSAVQPAVANLVELSIEDISEKMRECLEANNETIGKKRNCVKEGETLVNTAKNNIQLEWEFAELVRRRIGNVDSLKYFKQALDHKKTPYRCIEDGLDIAVKAGLRLSFDSYKSRVNEAKDIVFWKCWEEFSDEIIELTKRGESSYWMDNVCKELKGKKINPIPSGCS